MFSFNRYAVLVVIASALMTGCGEQRPEIRMATVTGTVFYGGKPLEKGQIVMVHQSGKMGIDEIRSDGSYRLEAAVGDNMVMIECRDQPNLSQISPKQGRGVHRPPSLIPERYSDYETSGLQLTVVDGMNTHDWNLVD